MRAFAVLHSCRILASILVLLAPLRAQARPEPEPLPLASAPTLAAILQRPAGPAAAFVPLVLVLHGDEHAEAAVALRSALADLGTAAATVTLPVATDPNTPSTSPTLQDLPSRLRTLVRIAGGGIRLVAIGPQATAAAETLAQTQPWQFGALVLVEPGRPLAASLPKRLWSRPITVYGAVETTAASTGPNTGASTPTFRPAPAPKALVAILTNQLTSPEPGRAQRTLAGRAVDQALDDFHDAAAQGDFDRYFARFPDDAVFLGTDPDERWDGRAFRRFAAPYFRRGSAWTFVPVVRHVTLAAGEQLAWFDERLDNEPYGECRGSGVLERRGDTWVVRHYDLTIPVPNDLANGLCARIRAARLGEPAPGRVVVLVRHAEKGSGDDPELTAEGQARAERLAQALAALAPSAVFASEFRRTQATVAPLCRGLGVAAQVVKAADSKSLVGAIRQLQARAVAVVAGHSNTLPMVAKLLGVRDVPAIDEGDFGWLWVVVESGDEARVLPLRY